MLNLLHNLKIILNFRSVHELLGGSFTVRKRCVSGCFGHVRDRLILAKNYS